MMRLTACLNGLAGFWKLRESKSMVITMKLDSTSMMIYRMRDRELHIGQQWKM